MLSNDCHNEKEKILVRRLVAGELAAFNEIYSLYFHPVYSNAVKITRDTAVAEDILQEVFITLWEKRTTIDPERSLAGWLFVLCYHRSINILKRRLRESLLYRQLPQPAENSAEDEMRFGIQWNILENAISRLSPQRRRVFELCKLQGKSYEQAAAELHISKYTVKEYLSAALTSIREYSLHHPESTALLLPLLFLS
ncbi:MAG: sigma-70 family RNA polymerase sigma factor [Chitinophagaceae bacterium]|nr:sigma-70 family RNA polymerase sigma factor [Chitinophagaceae bacterium]